MNNESSVRRLAWFSPMPPVPTGIAACSGDLVPALGRAYAIDVYVDEPAVAQDAGRYSAHDFLWRHRRTPYDLVVYQLGNSSHHDYQWPYLFHFPGLAVLHDAHLHHARAAALLRTDRASAYRAEFAAAEPDASADAAELAVAGFDNYLYYTWPMTRLVVAASRLTAVHTPRAADQLRMWVPGAAVEHIRLGHGHQLGPAEAHDARRRIRGRHDIADDAVLFGCFGALTPDKRVPQILKAFSAVLPYAPSARLLLAGAAAAHYDVAPDIAANGLQPQVIRTGYLESDAEMTDHIAACDVTLNLRWPTAREVSGPWLRCLAAGKATIVTDMSHIDVPSLDPRTWTAHLAPAPLLDDGRTSSAPICVAIDIVDEDHSLRTAMRRLACDAALRAALGGAAAAWWAREHTPDGMLDDYRRIIERAVALPAPKPELPPHLVDDGAGRVRALLQGFALPNPLDREPRCV